MTTKNAAITAPQLTRFTARKVTGLADTLHDTVPDSLAAWMTRYLTFAIVGVRSPAVAAKIALHLDRFIPSSPPVTLTTGCVEDDLSWMDDFDRVTRRDAKDVADEQYRNQRA